MPRFDLTRLNSVIVSDSNNAVTNSDPTNIMNKDSKQINWQLLASFLDSEIFQFIMQNKNDEKIKAFGLNLSQKLATNFGLVNNE